MGLWAKHQKRIPKATLLTSKTPLHDEHLCLMQLAHQKKKKQDTQNLDVIH
jgi:hypothetical protein